VADAPRHEAATTFLSYINMAQCKYPETGQTWRGNSIPHPPSTIPANPIEQPDRHLPGPIAPYPPTSPPASPPFHFALLHATAGQANYTASPSPVAGRRTMCHRLGRMMLLFRRAKRVAPKVAPQVKISSPKNIITCMQFLRKGFRTCICRKSGVIRVAGSF
jgi:hypothetical protein